MSKSTHLRVNTRTRFLFTDRMPQTDSGVSVLMTAYNAVPFIESAVNSILNQTFTDFEFIIVNDGSTDGTQAFLETLTDPRIKVFDEPNRGTAGGSNFGLQHCRRKYVARMDADDVSLPTRLEEQYKFMESNPQVSLVGTQIQIIGEERLGMEVAIPLKHAQIYQALIDRNHGMNHGSCFYRNELIQKIGGYWKIHKMFDDWDMFLRMAEQGELANLPQVLYQYRTLSNSLVGSKLKEMRDHFAYSIECARCRKIGEPSPELSDFMAELEKRPWTTRTLENLGVYALNQYRVATAELCANKPIRGYARLGWAAICSPQRTLNRLGRILSVGKARKKAATE